MQNDEVGVTNAVIIINAIASGLTSLATVVGVIVAYRGINTWKDQQTWKNNHDLARRMLVNLFKYREKIDNIRSPVIVPGEGDYPSEEDAVNMSAQQVSFAHTSTAYRKRVNALRDVENQLHADCLEARAIWGDCISEKMKPVNALKGNLLHVLGLYLAVIDPDINEQRREILEERLVDRYNVIYDDLIDDDPFKLEMARAMDNVEDYLKLKLGRA